MMVSILNQGQTVVIVSSRLRSINTGLFGIHITITSNKDRFLFAAKQSFLHFCMTSSIAVYFQFLISGTPVHLPVFWSQIMEHRVHFKDIR